MRRTPSLRRLTATVLMAGAVAAGWVAVGPVGPVGTALADGARPTVDPSAPTPTTPYDGLPPQGHAPDGSTVGGAGLDTRGLVTVAGAPPLPAGIDAHGWLVADAGTGQVLGAQDPHGRYRPASTLKTLTLLALAPVVDHALVVEATPDDEAVEGSRVGLVHGGRYSADLLFRALVMQSGNDAANALARAAGGVDATLAAMTATADRIGAFDTVPGTPSGLDVAGQSSSPYDLALVMRQLVADPYTLDVLQTRTAQLPGVGPLPGYQIQNQDRLLTDYPGTLAGKTGFTDAARHTFVAAAERDGRRLVVSLMQAERRPVPELEQATRLLDWGFSTAPEASGVGRLVDPGEVPAVAPPTPSTAATPSTATSPSAVTAPAGSAAPSVAGAPAGSDSAVLPAALAAAAVLVTALTVLGRRRARRPVPARSSTISRPPRPGPVPGGPAAGAAAGCPPRPPARRSPADRGPAAAGTEPARPRRPGGDQAGR